MKQQTTVSLKYRLLLPRIITFKATRDGIITKKRVRIADSRAATTSPTAKGVSGVIVGSRRIMPSNQTVKFACRQIRSSRSLSAHHAVLTPPRGIASSSAASSEVGDAYGFSVTTGWAPWFWAKTRRFAWQAELARPALRFLSVGPGMREVDCDAPAYFAFFWAAPSA